jgi:hypothetical protein
MIIGGADSVSDTAVKIATAAGAGTRVAVYRDSPEFQPGTRLLIAGSSGASEWFPAPMSGSPVDFVLELGEELWVKSSSDTVSAPVSWIVGNQ